VERRREIRTAGKVGFYTNYRPVPRSGEPEITGGSLVPWYRDRRLENRDSSSYANKARERKGKRAGDRRASREEIHSLASQKITARQVIDKMAQKRK